MFTFFRGLRFVKLNFPLRKSHLLSVAVWYLSALYYRLLEVCFGIKLNTGVLVVGGVLNDLPASVLEWLCSVFLRGPPHQFDKVKLIIQECWAPRLSCPIDFI